MSAFVYNGVSLEVNFADADFVEVFEDANKAVLDGIEQIKGNSKGKGNAALMREQCALINDMFDTIFGEGTAEMLFGGKNDVIDHFEAFGALVDMASEPNRKVNDITNKYLQKNNAQRNNHGHQQQKIVGYRQNQ